LRHLLSSSDTKVREKTCDIIFCVTKGNKEQTRAAIEAGIVPALIQFVADPNPDIRRNSASAISNVTEEGEPKEVRGWIPHLFSLLENSNFTEVILTALGILRIILQVVPDCDAWGRMLSSSDTYVHILSSSDTKVRGRACEVIMWITRGNKQQTRAVIEAGIVPVLIKLLVD
ncbi:unnamed protein product, partial [Ectocarpus sp. 8 AP-2014]